MGGICNGRAGGGMILIEGEEVVGSGGVVTVAAAGADVLGKDDLFGLGLSTEVGQGISSGTALDGRTVIEITPSYSSNFFWYSGCACTNVLP